MCIEPRTVAHKIKDISWLQWDANYSYLRVLKVSLTSERNIYFVDTDEIL